MQNFDFKEDYILEDDFVMLRPLSRNDFENLLHFSMTEPEIWKFSLIHAEGEEGLKNYLNLALEGRENEKEYPFIVFDKRENKYAGSTRFYDMQLSNKAIQLGYTWYGKQFQGTGLNKHCKFLLLQFAFETMQMERVEFRADNGNEKSKAAMKSIGCIEEGILRSSRPNRDGGRSDTIVLSILKEEWHDKVKELLKKKMAKK
ncbi:MAG: GNAT family N-acetyltransferase [Bacteroidia bacterium]